MGEPRWERRSLLKAAAATAALSPRRSLAQGDAFAVALAALARDLEAIDAANGVRERYQRIPGDPVGAGQAGLWRRASFNKISDRARLLIITCEVSGQAAYQRHYARPVWPGGQSGVTIGIGYDLGYASPAHFGTQWAELLDETTIARLATACGLKGESAQDALSRVQDLAVTWPQALKQFDTFLPYAIGKTEDTFRNAADLPPSCLGALVSLVYNRGPSLSGTSPSRLEMREIARLLREGNFSGVPSQIRQMKRLWRDDPRMRGLVARREAEALLFEEGLAS